MTDKELIGAIQGALNTEETGEALIEVARNACRAEQELAAFVEKVVTAVECIEFGNVLTTKLKRLGIT